MSHAPNYNSALIIHSFVTFYICGVDENTFFRHPYWLVVVSYTRRFANSLLTPGLPASRHNITLSILSLSSASAASTKRVALRALAKQGLLAVLRGFKITYHSAREYGAKIRAFQGICGSDSQPSAPNPA